jgi:uncharacterized repeat protein (TIGR02543 family)
MEQLLDPRIITFDSQGGTPVPSQTVYRGQKITRPPNPGYSGWTFIDWFKELEDVTPWNFNTEPEGDMTLYAKWDQGITIEKQTGAEVPPPIVTVNFNEKSITVIPSNDDPPYTGQTIEYAISTESVPPTVWQDIFTFTNLDATETYSIYARSKENDNYYAGWWSSMEVCILERYLNSLPTAGNNDVVLKLDNEQQLAKAAAAVKDSDKLINLDLSTSTIDKISNKTFEECSNLQSIIMPNTVISIGQLAFYNCTSLISVTIPESVTNIEYSAFTYCTSLTEITIPKNVTSIYGAFQFCTSLSKVTIEAQLQEIQQQAFSHCSSLTQITIPDTVKVIELSAFSNTGITSITIPQSVTTIGNDAFGSCTSLTTVTFNCNLAPSDFGNTPFPGDLVEKYLSTNPPGGIGTYTTQPTGTTPVWTKSD